MLWRGSRVRDAHPLEAEGAAGGPDAPGQVRGFHHQLPRLHPEPLGQRREHPLADGDQQGGARQGQKGAAAQPVPGQGHQQSQGREQQQHGEQQAQGETHVQIDEAGAGGHPTALHHQIEGRQGVAQGHHHRQRRHLGLQHPLLGAAEAVEAQIGEAAALADGEQQTGRQAHHALGEEDAQQQPQGRQAQHREGEIDAGEGIPFAEGRGQQGRQPEAPPPRHRRGRARQGRGKGDAQRGERPEQQGQQQTARQGRHQQGGQIPEDGETGDHIAAEGIRDQPPGLHHQIAQPPRQHQHQADQHPGQGTVVHPQQGLPGPGGFGRLLPQTPAALQLGQLQPGTQAEHQEEGDDLQHPATQQDALEVELGEPEPFDREPGRRPEGQQQCGGNAEADGQAWPPTGRQRDGEGHDRSVGRTLRATRGAERGRAWRHHQTSDDRWNIRPGRSAF